jgi:hypothetical protein
MPTRKGKAAKGNKQMTPITPQKPTSTSRSTHTPATAATTSAAATTGPPTATTPPPRVAPSTHSSARAAAATHGLGEKKNRSQPWPRLVHRVRMNFQLDMNRV